VYIEFLHILINIPLNPPLIRGDFYIQYSTIELRLRTTVTALLAATAITGTTAVLAFQIALVHLLFNLAAIILIFSIPFLRNVLPALAENMAAATLKN
jgi:solute carrier family 34 (sodium-dependent phosphate cotransporter)